jgi:Holliday junction resolvase RusA-like endonuclease
MPHMCRPDLDNLAKSLFDALYANDSIIYSVSLAKYWEEEGSIIIEKED